LDGVSNNEPGRYDQSGGDWNGGPRHEVRLTKGYWLFDKPVTQELWVAVMSKNPSYFIDPKRPVEQVSWDDTAQFLERINGLPGPQRAAVERQLDFRLLG